jgi:hypothetical protein
MPALLAWSADKPALAQSTADIEINKKAVWT